MATSFLKRVFSRTPKKQNEPETPTVDISRVIPEYAGSPQTTPVEANVSETEASSATPPAATDVPEEKAEAAVDALSAQHDEWAQADLNALQDAWTTAQENLETMSGLHEVRLAAHNLKGMATNYGHPAMARLATSLCALLEAETGPETAGLINLHVEACRAAYHESRTGDGSDAIAQSVCAALETQVKRTLEA